MTDRITRRLGLVLLLGTAAGAAWAQGASRFDGQYMGELILSSVITGDCTQPPLGSVYPLTITRGEVRFLYAPRFNTTLIGRVADNGVFRASARLRHGVIQMTGRIQGLHLVASITSPSCNYTFQTRE